MALPEQGDGGEGEPAEMHGHGAPCMVRSALEHTAAMDAQV